jgi:hypothetical protein
MLIQTSMAGFAKKPEVRRKFALEIRISGIRYQLKDPQAKKMQQLHNPEKGSYSRVDDVSENTIYEIYFLTGDNFSGVSL